MATQESTGASGTAYLRSFEQFLEHHRATPVKGKKVMCSGCHRTDPKCWLVESGNPSVECEACLRYAWGYDQAQAATISAMVGATVASLLKISATTSWPMRLSLRVCTTRGLSASSSSRATGTR